MIAIGIHITSLVLKIASSISPLVNWFVDENGDHLVDENGDRLGET